MDGRVRNLRLLIVVLAIMTSVNITSVAGVTESYIIVNFNLNKEYTFESGTWNEFVVPFNTNLHASDVVDLGAAEMIAELNPSTGKWMLFIPPYDAVGGTDDFSIKCGYAYLVFGGNSDESFIISGSQSLRYYTEYGAYRLLSFAPMTIKGNTYIKISNPYGLYERTIGELFSPATLSGGVSVISVQIYNKNGNVVETLTYDQARTRVFQSYTSIGIKLSGTSTWSPNNEDLVPPTISITSPYYTVVRGPVMVRASAFDSYGIWKVQFYIDGVLRYTDTTSSYEYYWNTYAYSNSYHTIMVKAFDSSGNIATSSSMRVKVKNYSPPPPPIEF